MMGRWLNETRGHVCRTPSRRWFRRAETGDQWRCHCGHTWQLTIGPDPDGGPFSEWRWKCVT